MNTFLQLKLSYQDDTPIRDESGVVTVRHGFSHNQEEYNRTDYPIPSNGILELNFYPPMNDDVYTLGIEVLYHDCRCGWLIFNVYHAVE